MPAARLTEQQRAQLVKLVEVYARTFESGLAEARMARVREGGIENIRFGWAGATERGRQHYYRVQGPLFLIEYDASQDGGNHIHTVWRDFDGDFGRDLLRAALRGRKGHAAPALEGPAKRGLAQAASHAARKAFQCGASIAAIRSRASAISFAYSPADNSPRISESAGTRAAC